MLKICSLCLLFLCFSTATANCGNSEETLPIFLTNTPVYVSIQSDTPRGRNGCRWSIITTSRSSLVRITFQEFELQEDTLCTDEYLLISVIGSPEEMKFCGKSYPKTIETRIQFSTIKIKYFSNLPRSDSQFKLRIEKISEVCSGVTFLPVTKNPSFLYSPGYPSDYLPDLNCKWQLNNSNPDEVVILEFVKFDVESNCIYDNVTIATEKSNVTKCGHEEKMVLKYPESSINLQFSTDLITQSSGFILRYYTVPRYDSDCDRSSRFEVESSNDRRRVVTVGKTNGKSCSWTIKASDPSHVVILELLSFYNSPYTCFLKFGISERHRNVSVELYSCIDQAVKYYRSASDTIDVKFKDDSEKYYSIDGNLTFSFYSVPKDQFVLEEIPVDNIPTYIYVPGDSGLINRKQPSFIFDSRDTDKGCVEVSVLAANRRNISRLTDYYEFYDGKSDFGTDIGGPCDGLMDTVSGTNQYMFVRKKKGRYAGMGTWLKIQRISSCAGKVIMFDVISGEREITSPNYPQKYGRNQVCRWAFKNYYELNGRVWTLDTIPLSSSGSASNLCTDSVEISYGESLKPQTSLATWCIDSRERYHVTDKYMFITFRSSSFINKAAGFRLVANLTDSGIKHCQLSQTVAEVDTVKYITSPFYPGHYTNNYQCTQYVVTKEKYHVISITVVSVDLPSMYGGCGDSLSIYDSQFLMKKYCSKTWNPETFTTTGNVARIHFQTNKDTVARGFNLSVKAIDVSGDCNRDFQVELRVKYISSNNYPGQYNRGLECFYLLNKHYGYGSDYHITVEMVDFNLPPPNRDRSCTKDYLVVYDGSEPTVENHKDTVCGSIANETTPRKFVAVSNHMMIQFITQSTGRFYGGFRLKYYLTQRKEGQCLSVQPLTLKAESQPKYITSPNYPSGYNNNEFCQWLLSCTNLNIVKLTLLSSNLGAHAVLQVYDSSTRQDSLLGEIRGREQQEYTSTGCHMLVVFISDARDTHGGFRAEYTEIEYQTESLAYNRPIYERPEFVGAIIGLMLLIFVLAPILSCYCYKRRKARRRNTQRMVYNQVNGAVYNTTTNNVYISTNSNRLPYPNTTRLYNENDLPPPYIAHMLYQPRISGLPSYEEANMYEIPNTRSPLSSLGDSGDEVWNRRTSDRSTREDFTIRHPHPASSSSVDDSGGEVGARGVSDRPTREDFAIRHPRPATATRSIPRSESNELMLTPDTDGSNPSGTDNPNLETEVEAEI